MLDSGPLGSGDLDSHFRYLSGLLLAIGIGFASTVPRIEAQGGRFWLLTGIVMVGGYWWMLKIGRVARAARVDEAAA